MWLRWAIPAGCCVPLASMIRNSITEIKRSTNPFGRNIHETEKASIRIIKTLEGSSGVSREYIESLEFTFRIYDIKGYEPEFVTLKTPTRQDENGNWVWEGTSSEYVWLYGNNPTYKIEEVNTPEGTHFDNGRSQVEGTLVSDETANYEVKNNIINKFAVFVSTAKVG